MLEIEKNRKMREKSGLSYNLPADLWTNRHLLRIYKALEELHERMDEIQAQYSPNLTDVSSENGGMATNESTTGDSNESSGVSRGETPGEEEGDGWTDTPKQGRFQRRGGAPEEEERDEGRYTVYYQAPQRR